MTSLPVGNTRVNCNTCLLDLGFFLGNQVNPHMVHIRGEALRTHLILKNNENYNTVNAVVNCTQEN